jgi:hypothetical protein
MCVLLNDQICIKPMGLYAGGEKAMFLFKSRAGGGSLMKMPGSCNSFKGKGMLASRLGYPLYCFV